FPPLFAGGGHQIYTFGECVEVSLIFIVCWFRYLVKQVYKDMTYKWYEMSFFSHGVDGAQKLMLCLDTPCDFKKWLLEAVNSPPIERNLGVYSMHLFIVEALVCLYDHALWGLRHVVRDIEKVG